MFFVAHYTPRNDKTQPELAETKNYSGIYFDQICRIGALVRHEPQEDEIKH